MFNPGDNIATNYQLKYRLGGGSFGEVWLAHNNLADIDVAIKFYNSLDSNGIRDFRREFQLAYKLQHPNLLHLNHFDVYNNCPYLVMPYCSRGSAASLIGRVGEREIWRFLRDVSAGLEYLHKQRPALVHQDIKPDNILIADDGRYMLSDFGISHKVSTSTFGTGKGSFSAISGTLAYMGPEHFIDKKSVTTASDIWALGMSIYELAHGDVLWCGVGGNAQISGSEPPTLGPEYSYELNKLARQCLSAEPSRRPTASSIYRLACGMLSAGSSYQTPPPTPPVTPPTPPIIPPERRNKPNDYRKYIGVAACIAAGIMAVIVGVFWYASYTEYEQEKQRFYSCRSYNDYVQFINDYPESNFRTIAVDFINRKNREKALHDSIDNRNKHLVAPAPVVDSEPKTTDPYNRVVVIPLVPPDKPKKPTDNKGKDTEKEKQLLKKKAEQAEADFFNSCRTISDYDAYMRKYPKGRFYHEARRRIGEIEEGKKSTENNIYILVPEDY